jgi:GNAT superfamily N-acetyltransferase
MRTHQSIKIRPLAADDWQLKRDLRLTALRDSPALFRSKLADELDRTEGEWRAWFADNAVVFAAWVDKNAVGLAGAWVPPDGDGAVELTGMWVDPAARGCGVAGQLTEAVVEWTRQQNRSLLRLEYAVGNAPAYQAYIRFGFSPVDRQPGCVGGAVMELPLE